MDIITQVLAGIGVIALGVLFIFVCCKVGELFNKVDSIDFDYRFLHNRYQILDNERFQIEKRLSRLEKPGEEK